ncbi:EcoRII N-terminal effector-binding domain-containing protein [Candidatus Poriferisodalis sp.]|uniref:EcoRII N-terminal effector-binding domain-containing protein n=1 Tax=Candidatus Poriferisodalis sp. TaxID=3101277 RepID=UPI003B5AA234
MNEVDATDWLVKAIRDARIICAKRLAYPELGGDDGRPDGLHLPGNLILDLAPELRLRGGNDRTAPVALVGAFGDTNAGVLVWHGLGSGKDSQGRARLHDLSGVASPLRDPENSGALAVLAFERSRRGIQCDYVVCRTIKEEDQIEDRLGPVDPGYAVIWGAHAARVSADDRLPRWLPLEMPADEW